VATLRVGDVQITRVEESYGPGFRASMLMPKFDLDAVENHGPDVFAQFMQLDTQAALLSVHTWVVRTPRSVVLVDTCTGNHKLRPSMPSMHMLETPYLERLAAWVPTLPNAAYVMNATEVRVLEPDEPGERRPRVQRRRVRRLGGPVLRSGSDVRYPEPSYGTGRSVAHVGVKAESR
jgi:hypothetical protein